MTIEPHHLANLTKLADWLERHIDPETPEWLIDDNGSHGELHMGFYSVSDKAPVCQSAGCAIGWASHAIEPRQVDKFQNLEYWTDFAVRLFGVSDATIGAGVFMFSGEWTNITDRVSDAVDRIRAVVELDGQAPKEWPNWDGRKVVVEP